MSILKRAAMLAATMMVLSACSGVSNESGSTCLLYIDYLGTHYSAANVRVKGLTKQVGEASEPYCRDQQPNDAGQKVVWEIAGVSIDDAFAVRIQNGQSGMLYLRDDDNDNTVIIPQNMKSRLKIVDAQ